MGMPIEVEIVRDDARDTIEAVFAYLKAVDRQFSTYKKDSEISRINRGDLTQEAISTTTREIFELAEKTKVETNGYFDIRRPDGSLDPSGVVKGWAIHNAAALIKEQGHKHFFVNAGGDIAMGGENADGKEWSVGIRNPFKRDEIVKVIYPHGKGVATSGTYIRGAHIYNPLSPEQGLRDVVSITVIGPNVLDADLYATAAFAMGRDGIVFLEQKQGFEGYAIDADGVATLTSGFASYTMP